MINKSLNGTIMAAVKNGLLLINICNTKLSSFPFSERKEKLKSNLRRSETVRKLFAGDLLSDSKF